MCFLKNRCGSFSENGNYIIHPDYLLASVTGNLRVKLQLNNNNIGGYYTVFFLSLLPDFVLFCVKVSSGSFV